MRVTMTPRTTLAQTLRSIINGLAFFNDNEGSTVGVFYFNGRSAFGVENDTATAWGKMPGIKMVRMQTRASATTKDGWQSYSRAHRQAT